jgi:hypothetical protein
MFNTLIDGGHKAIGGGVLIAEITAFLSGDRAQQIGLLVAGALVWISHYVWDQRKKKREDHNEDRKSARSNRLLDELERKTRAAIKDGHPIPYPELVHLLADRDMDRGDGESK